MYTPQRISKYICGFLSFNQKCSYSFSLFRNRILNVHNMHKCNNSNFRGKFSILTTKDIDYFHTILPSASIIKESEELGSYNTDWLKSHKGK